jgi:predicted nucleic acid-binding OB-fold protein
MDPNPKESVRFGRIRIRKKVRIRTHIRIQALLLNENVGEKLLIKHLKEREKSFFSQLKNVFPYRLGSRSHMKALIGSIHTNFGQKY